MNHFSNKIRIPDFRWLAMDGAAPEYGLRTVQPGARGRRCMAPDQGSGFGRNE